jgi:molybdate transport system ATP-binding protein
MISVDVSKSLYSAEGEIELSLYIQINEGDFVSLFGVSGAGKTTFLRILAGLEVPKSGKIVVDGEVWFDKEKKINLPTQKRGVGFVFQDYALFPNMSVQENLSYALQKGDDKRYIDEVMQTMGIFELADRRPTQLSGGQKQRVALARALVMRPKILLLDEPLSALDSAMRTKLQDELIKAHKHFGVTTVLVSHDPSEIFKLCNRVIWIENGRLKASGKPAQIFINRSTTATFEFVGELLQIEKNEMVYVLVLHIGQEIVKTIATKSEVEGLRVGDRVRVIAKSFHPIIEKIEL